MGGWWEAWFCLTWNSRDSLMEANYPGNKIGADLVAQKVPFRF